MSDLFERISKLSPKRLALLAMDLQSKLDAAESGRNEPIAVIGMACRFPGAASPEAYWELLSTGSDAIREIPSSRWDIDTYYDPDPDAPGKMATRWGGFLDQIDGFEPQLFGIAPREAASMDPQQRLLLEVAWETMERAGYAPDSLHGSATGAFIGICNADYSQLLMEGDEQDFDMYLSTGNASSIASGRLSYVFGFQGPAISVDTACSSSLVALHLAIQSLRDGACRAALAGGVNAILSPKTTMVLSRARMMAADGRCKAFDARADGFVRSEGCGLVMLKRLSDARADGDTVLALIRGSAINQDGRSNGLTAPNGPSQVAVIRAALADAQVEPAELSYVETHGTGTSLGDPIEAQALGMALGAGRLPNQRLMIGSVKTNIGHLESAAGIAGLIKVILMLQHAQIPPLLHMTRPNPYINWDELPLALPTEITPWLPVAGRYLAGVSSFGFSGTNAHLVLEATPPAAMHPAAETERPLHLLKLTARSEVALRELADRYAHHLANNPSAIFADIAYTAAVGRSELSHRCAVVAATADQAVAALSAFAAGGTHEALVAGALQSQRQPEVVFLFTGHGSHYPNMGRQLYQTQPVFRAALERCAELLTGLVDRPLLDILFSDTGDRALEQMAYSQPALFAIEYALATLWQSWGVRPVAVAGHSAGEYVAAVIAGVCSLEDGLRLIAARGRLMGSLPADGAMAAVLASEERVTRAIAAYAGQVSIAAINGPESVALSGKAGALQAVLDELRAEGVEVRPLAIPVAAHSPQVEPILDAFERVAAEVRYNPPQIEVISGMTGRPAQEGDLVRANYWRHHLRQPVRFADAMRTLYEQGRRIFVEIGPHPTLLNMGRHIVPEHECAWLPSLRSGHDDWAQMLHSASILYTRGLHLDWNSFDAPYSRRRVALPSYPFQRERYWVPHGSKRRRSTSKGEHPLLGQRLRSARLHDIVFETQLGAHFPAFLDHHRVYGSAIMPSPVYLEMAQAAAHTAFGAGLFTIENFSIREALILPEDGERSVQLILGADGPNTSFEILSYEQKLDQWTLHATGQLLRATDVAPVEAPFQPDLVRARCEHHIAGTSYYEQLRALGLEFGTSFRGLTDIWRRDGEALGRIVLPDLIASEAPIYGIHPALLDACFHLLGAPLPTNTEQTAYLLIAIERFRLYTRPGGQLWNHTVLRAGHEKAGETFTGDIRLYDQSGQLVAEVLGLHLKLAGREALLRATHQLTNDWLYEVQWQLKPHSTIPTPTSPLAPQVADELVGRVAALETRYHLPAYRELVPALDLLSLAFVVAALHKLGWAPYPAEHVNTARLAAQLQIVPRHARLFGRMLAMLAEEGWLCAGDSDWTVVADPIAIGDPHVMSMALRTRFPGSTAEITLAERCGDRLAEVLRGEADPLQLLFPAGSQETAEQIYRDAPFARIANQLVADAVATAAADLTDDRILRILEIGGGTGATTAAILPILPAGRAEYYFTDISPLFTARAAERFGTQPGLRCQVLDIERDPAAQGFELAQFDMIIAANVLHATSNLRSSLDHVKQLLAPSGLLLLVEGTCPSRWADITFGLTEGWWRFTDHELRHNYPLLERAEWLSLLTSVGFQDAATVPALAEADLAGQAILLARAPTAPRTQHAASNWLLLADTGGVAQQLRARLETHGIAAALSDAVDQAALQTTYSRIVDLRGLNTPMPSAALNAGELQECVAASTSGALTLVQSLIAAGSLGDLWIVTRGAQAAGNLLNAPGQAPLWGLGRVIALEHPEVWGGLIDLDPAGTPEGDAAALVTELLHNDGEDQVAVRDQQRLVARLARRSQPATLPPHWKPEASYLITGGLGGLGLKLAHWMATSGAQTLVLTSRRGLPPRAAWDSLPSMSREASQVAAIRAIEALGTQVQIVAADVADVGAMQALFNRFGHDLPPLRGIIHAAAALSNWSIATMPAEELRRMLAPKVAGAWQLHQLSHDLPLDFFVLFSSTTALWGSRELGHYAAANQFLDALAHYRQAQGLPALSINWGTWDEMRVASDAERRSVASFGLNPLPSDQALELLGKLLMNPNTAQLAVASVDWSLLKPAYETRRQRPFLAHMASRSAAPPVTITDQPTLLAQLEGVPIHERRDVMMAFLRSEVARALGIQSPQTIDTSMGLFEMGMDSLMSVELKARIEAAVGENLPSTLTFNYPTIDALAGFLDERVLPVVAQELTVPVIQAVQTNPVIDDDTSEDDLAALLAAKLARRR